MHAGGLYLEEPVAVQELHNPPRHDILEDLLLAVPGAASSFDVAPRIGSALAGIYAWCAAELNRDLEN